MILLINCSLYSQSFIFNCTDYLDPQTHVQSFIADAEGYDYDFSQNEISIVWGNYGFNASTTGRCSSNDTIYIDTDIWNSSSKTDLWRKYLIYHELGHALLNLEHVCNFGESGVILDIMFALAACTPPYNFGEYEYSYSTDENFSVMSERMFTLTDQIQANCE